MGNTAEQIQGISTLPIEFGAAFADYLAFARKGGTEPFETLVEKAGITSPFKDGALTEIAAKVLKIEEELRAKF